MASDPRRRLTLAISIIGTVVVTLYAAWAYIHIIVLNPLAAVPGLPLEEIWRQTELSQGSIDRFVVPAILAVGPVLALILLVLGQILLRNEPEWVVVGYLGILVLGAPAEFVASFSPGMNLADTFAISGADYSPWAAPLMATSALALVAFLASIAAIGFRAARSSASPAAAG
ncbi:hypothetical protein FBY40_1282 [Microbacterium sp. SLBN-154]|uniref:hypothetical protein n=1 Tax=Microbacterium sp. SLBN-154 TaxID=2768458 RepID=UPI001152703D|nr:hypothetical protein [Microbacterium sp. SLBN-154]TQK18793.1 hypothetical protein FBY40_1282 [Microbacterium sp. SLBN-154]